MHQYWALLMLQLLFLLWLLAGTRLATSWQETCGKNDQFAKDVGQDPGIFYRTLLMYIFSNTLSLAWYTWNMEGEFHTPPWHC